MANHSTPQPWNDIKRKLNQVAFMLRTHFAAATNQPSSSRTLPCSTHTLDGTETTKQNNAWPPLEVTDCSLEGWSNSNHESKCDPSTIEGAITPTNDNVTPTAAPRTPAVRRDPSGSQKSTSSIDRNPFFSGYTKTRPLTKAPKEPNEKPPVAVEENPLRYLFRTPPAGNANFGPNNIRESTCTPNSRTSAETALDSPITKVRKESQAVREDFRNSLAQLSQVHSRLAQQNSEHAMRADVIMRDMDEMRNTSKRTPISRTVRGIHGFLERLHQTASEFSRHTGRSS